MRRLAITRRSPLRGGPRRVARASPPRRSTGYQSPSRRPHASTRNYPPIPASRGPSSGGSRLTSSTFDGISIAESSASCVDSQLPADPRFAGALVGWLAPHLLDVRRDINRRVVGLMRRLAITRRSPLRGGPRRVARASPPRRSTGYQSPSRRPHASTRNYPPIPASRGPWSGGSRLTSSTFDGISIAESSASSVDSQLPADPRFAGALVGWLAPHLLDVRRDINRRVVGLMRRLAITRRSPLRGGPGRVARASPPRRSTGYQSPSRRPHPSTRNYP